MLDRLYFIKKLAERKIELEEKDGLTIEEYKEFRRIAEALENIDVEIVKGLGW